MALVVSYFAWRNVFIMTAIKTDADTFIKQRMMAYLKDQGYNFYQSATLLKLSDEERAEMSRYWAE